MKLVRVVREHLGEALWTLAWMWPLIAPVTTIAQGEVRPAAPAAIGLAGFVVLYVVTVVRGFEGARSRPTRADYTLLALTCAVGLGLIAAYGTHPHGWLNIMLYVAVAGAAMLTPRQTIAWVGSALVIFLIWALVGPGRGFEPDESTDILQVVLNMMLASGLVFAVKQMMRYMHVLRTTRAELARTAVSEERLRFARDLHDLLGHTLSLIVVKAEVVRRLIERDPEAAGREAADIEAIGRQALTEVRDAVTAYREPTFEAELARVRGALEDVGIRVRVRASATPLPEPASRLFGWAIREAATNVIRHSQARSCAIAVHTDRDAATLVVADDGVGAAPDAVGGTGLLGLNERLAAAGGAVTTSTRPDGGFRFVATVPCGAVADPACGEALEAA